MDAKWLSKPYYSLDAYMKHTYGEKYYKLALDGGFTCPNRDGTAGHGGCIFCSAGGSGDFARRTDASSIREQFPAGKKLLSGKNTGNRFIAYFQAYTGTYAPVPYLRDIYTAALSLPETAGISIATRPDCLGKEVLALLAELKTAYSEKFIWIELGLQTIHEDTAAFFHRGYTLPVFEEAMKALARIDIPVIVHVILGLPYETPDMMYGTIRYLNGIPNTEGPFDDDALQSFGDEVLRPFGNEPLRPFGIKLQLLHILQNTALGDMYLNRQLSGFSVLSQEEYIDILIHCLELLSPDIVIHRLTGDGPKNLLLAPLWSLQKRNVLNTLHKTMKQRHTYQGRCFYAAGSTDPI